MRQLDTASLPVTKPALAGFVEEEEDIESDDKVLRFSEIRITP